MSAPAQDSTTVRTTSGIAIEDLRIVLTNRENVDVVDDIDLVLRPGEVVGLVGESGSGKTTVGTALLGYTRPGAHIEAGKVMFEDKDYPNFDPLFLINHEGVREFRKATDFFTIKSLFGSGKD